MTIYGMQALQTLYFEDVSHISATLFDIILPFTRNLILKVLTNGRVRSENLLLIPRPPKT